MYTYIHTYIHIYIHTHIYIYRFLDASAVQEGYDKLSAGELGCLESHYKAYGDAVKRNKYTIILEDDAVFNQDYNLIDDIHLLLANKDKWEIAHFGHCLDTSWGRLGEKYDPLKKQKNAVFGDFVPGTNPECTHAYIVSPSGAAKLLDLINIKPEGRFPVDRQLALLIQDKKIEGLVQTPAKINQDWQLSDVNMGWDSIHSKTHSKAGTRKIK